MIHKKDILKQQDEMLEEDESTDISLDDVVFILKSTFLHPIYVWSIAILFYGNSLVLNDEDTVVVTGGSSGLGRALITLLVAKGVKKLINLDINDNKEHRLSRVEFIKCDVGSEENVRRAAAEISGKYGPVTVLINNAGTTSDKTLLDLSCEEIRKIVEVNLLGNFWTAKAFVPDMVSRKRGYLVTVASVLGKIGPAGVSAYCASKAGLIAFHDSFTHELKEYSGIKTLLVTPGQMDGPMFEGVETPDLFLAPVIDHKTVAQQIVNAIEKGDVGELSLPLYAGLMPWAKILPQSILEIVRSFYGMDKAIKKRRRV